MKKFVELSKDEFFKVENDLPGNSFYQTTDWANLKKITGWDSCYVGIMDNKKIVAASLLLSKNMFFGKKMFYAPRGYLMDFDDKELLELFSTEIKKYVKKNNGIFVKIDPLVEYKYHDKNGDVIDGDFSNEDLYNLLKKLGYKHKGFTIGYSSELQFRWSYCLDINRDKEDIFKEMDQRCRRCIRKYEKYPLKMVDVNEKNIDDFKAIMEHTAIRQNHFDRSKDYYMSLKDNLGDRVKMVIIYLDRDKYLDDFKDDKLYDRIKDVSKKMIPISAGVFIFDKDRANYVYGGTYSYYMSLMAQYKLQMDMIYLAKEKGIKLYDFGGISGNFIPGTPDYGVYEFKRGFGGYVVEYIGEYDLVVNKFLYNLYNMGYSLYRNLKKIKSKFKK